MTFKELPQEVQDTFKNAFYGRHDINLLLHEKNITLKCGKFLEAIAIQNKINNLLSQSAEGFAKQMEKEVQNIELKDLDLPEEDNYSINILALKMFMCCDIIDGAIKDINTILHKTDEGIYYEQFDDHVPVIECAGVLGHGERVFITAKFPEDVILDNKGDDKVEMYMMFTTSHDGTGAVKCVVSPIRTVCENTMRMALAHNAGMLSLRHSSNIMQRLELTSKENTEFAFKALNLMKVYKTSLEQRFDHHRLHQGEPPLYRLRVG